jgi:hypothetical protein
MNQVDRMVKVKQTGKERRQAIRAKRILSIQYRLIKNKGKAKVSHTPWYLSTTHDMSILGISFLSEVPFQIRDILEMHVVMSGVLDIFKGEGQVVRVEQKIPGAFYLIAVKFVDNRTVKKTPRTSSQSKAKTDRIKNFKSK